VKSIGGYHQALSSPCARAQVTECYRVGKFLGAEYQLWDVAALKGEGLVA
jgi:hypothetical protein